MDFKSLHSQRKEFLLCHKDDDFAILNGDIPVLLSAPHGVEQTRLGKFKAPEIGSLATTLELQKMTNCFLIAKTKNNFDDANFDEKSAYKDAISSLIQTQNIGFVLDIHGLAKNRACDINLGTHLGKNIETNLPLFDKLQNSLRQNGFIVTVDAPFMAAANTISSSVHKKFPNVWTIQIEINCGITNDKANFHRWQKLLIILKDFIENM